MDGVGRIPGLVEYGPKDEIPASRPERGSTNVAWRIAGGLGGAVAGTAAGGILGLAAGSSGSRGLAPLIMGVGVIGGAALGFMAPKWIGDSRHERHMELYGPTPQDAASAVVHAFDHNRSGTLELDNPTGIPERDERYIIDRDTRTETVHRPDPFDWDNDGSTIESDSQRYGIERMISARVLLEQADTDGDQVVSAGDIAERLEVFDTDGNGHIDAREQQEIRRQGLVDASDWSRS